METDSTLSAIALAVSALVFVATELGAASIVAGMQARATSVLNGTADRFASLNLVTKLPTSPTAPFRLMNLLALGAAAVSASTLIWSVWGTGWEPLSAGGALVVLGLAATSHLARALGMRYSARLCRFTPRAAWLLSVPLRPFLLVEAIIVRSPLSEDQTPSAPLMDVTLADATQERLDEHEVRMIRGVVQLDKTIAREIMVPRVDIVAVESHASLKSLVDEIISTRHSRVPIYDGDLDHVVGVAHARDALQKLASAEDSSKIAARQVSREPLFIPESKTLEGLLEVFQEERTHLAVVVDEYGGVSGIVTIEDLLEEIVGEIRDEFDTEEAEIQRVTETEFVVDARIPIDELNERLGVEVVGEGFDTIGGLVFDRLGTIPVAGDRVDHAGLSIEVIGTSGRRPTTLRVRLAPTADAETSSR